MAPPDGRMLEIRKIIGTPADGGAVKYRQRLHAETSKDNTLMQYLDWSIKNPVKTAEMPKLSPRDVLGKLSLTDYGDIPSVNTLRAGMSFAVISHMELAKDKSDLFVIKADPEAVYHEEPAEDDAPAESPIHPGFLKSRTAAPGAGELPFPAIVLPIGKLLWKDVRPIEQFGDTLMQKDPKNRDFEEANYSIVVDACNPQHPVWLVFNRTVIDDLSQNLITVDPVEARTVFRSIGKNFDAAQLFPSVRDWLSQYNTIRLDTVAASIQKTMRMGAVTFHSATEKEVSEATGGRGPAPSG